MQIIEMTAGMCRSVRDESGKYMLCNVMQFVTRLFVITDYFKSFIY